MIDETSLWYDVFLGKLYPKGCQSVISVVHETSLIYASLIRFLQDAKNDGNVLEIYYD